MADAEKTGVISPMAAPISTRVLATLATVSFALACGAWLGSRSTAEVAGRPPATNVDDFAAEASPRLADPLERNVTKRNAPPRGPVQPARAAAIDATHVIEVRSTVGGRIVTIGSVAVKVGGHGAVKESTRSLHPGDMVAKGQVLATVWSPQLGELKSRFLAAASRLMFDEASLARLNEESADEADLAEAKQHCSSDRASLLRAEQALREIDFSDELIEALRTAAAEIHQERPDYSRAETWAEFELRAPRDGTLVQVAPGPGGNVEAGAVLFQLAHVRELAATPAENEFLAAEDPSAP